MRLFNVFDQISRWTGIKALRGSTTLARQDDEVTLDLPTYHQVDTFSCGATAGFSVVAAFRQDCSFDQFYESLAPIPGQGVSCGRLVRTLRKFRVGCRVQEYMSFNQIVKSIDAGFPIIAGRLTEHGEDHWCVVYGYGRQPKRVFLIGRSANPLLPAQIDWEAFRSSFRAVRGPAIQCWGI